jgi:acylpyruvate hydrolase
MHLATCEFDKESVVGSRIADDLFHLGAAYRYWFGETAPAWLKDMRLLLEGGQMAMDRVRKLNDKIQTTLSASGGRETLVKQGIMHSLGDVRLSAPISNPGKIICVGRNYRDHCLEQNKPIPKTPILFSKFSTAIVGPDDRIVRPQATSRLDFEGELAFVVGKKGRHISVDEAMAYVIGYTIFNDVSARDIQFSDGQWLRGKTFDTFAPTGPFLVTKDVVENPHDLGIEVRVNGETMQKSSTRNMIFDIPYLVHFISGVVSLSPGDMVATGTPAGVGVFREPPVFLQDGDEVAVEIEKLGILRSTVVDEKVG